eukprot:403365633
MGLEGLIQMFATKYERSQMEKYLHGEQLPIKTRNIMALGKFVELKEYFISACKFVIGFVGLGIGINNYVKKQLYNRQEEELNNYLIFISCYFMVEGSDMVYDIFSEKFIDKSKKSQDVKFKYKCISRIFQLVPTLIYAGFSIGGFVSAKRDQNPLQFDFVIDEKDQYSKSHQTGFNYTASYEDAQDLTESYASEYLTFSILTVMGLIKQKDRESRKSAILYNFIFGLIQAIIGIVITLQYNSLDISFLLKDDSVLEDYQLSQKTSKLFSTGAETLFLVLHFIDNIADELTSLLPISLSEIETCRNGKCEKFNIACFTFFAIMAWIVNLSLGICQALSADYLIRNFGISNLNSPIFLFVFSLIFECIDNFLDFLMLCSIFIYFCLPCDLPKFVCFLCYQLLDKEDQVQVEDQGVMRHNMFK